ncbi:hypothetical protein A9Q83_09840 [Alphaproteobacteria bacterium 46_93_T64]|nr:hypothetical protein A9Q83_09840 [Alphaproteobacteria bacterium 46_93_T64]
MLTREDFTPERIDNLIAEARKHGPYEALTHEERENNRQQFLNSSEIPSEGLWVFGYGSLLWNPAFNFVSSEPAKLYGYRRHFCLHMNIGRGSPEKPGIMLALDTGGSCEGQAFLIDPKEIESETQILWMREMLSGAYLPHWGKIKLQGKTVSGLTFVVNRKHSRYLPHLTVDETLIRLAQGEGYLGTSREYLENTIEHLDEINVRDGYLHELRDQLLAEYPKGER